MARNLKIGVVPSEMSEDNSTLWTLKPDERVDVIVLVNLDEIVSGKQYVMWGYNPAPSWIDLGEDDPGKELGIKPGHRAFVPVAVTIDGEQQVKIWSVGVKIHRELAEFSELADGHLEGLIVRVKRIGSGKKTKYSLMNTGKRVNVNSFGDIPTSDDVIRLLGPDTRESVIKSIEDKTGKMWNELINVSSSNDEEIVTEIEF